MCINGVLDFPSSDWLYCQLIVFTILFAFFLLQFSPHIIFPYIPRRYFLTFVETDSVTIEKRSLLLAITVLTDELYGVQQQVKDSDLFFESLLFFL